MRSPLPCSFQLRPPKRIILRFLEQRVPFTRHISLDSRILIIKRACHWELTLYSAKGILDSSDSNSGFCFRKRDKLPSRTCVRIGKPQHSSSFGMYGFMPQMPVSIGTPNWRITGGTLCVFEKRSTHVRHATKHSAKERDADSYDFNRINSE